MTRITRIAQYLVRTASLDDRIALLAKKYPQVPEDMIREMASVDPTGSRAQYLEWLVRNLQKGFIRWPGDRNRAAVALEFYHRIKRSSRVREEYGIFADINRYTMSDIEDLHDRMVKTDLRTQRQTQGEAKKRGARIIYNHGGYQIIQIGGEGSDLDQAAQAACLYAKGTRWCTSDPEIAIGYLRKSPLYIILKDRQKVAQFDPQTGQVNDVANQRIWWRDHPDIFSLIFNSPIPRIGAVIESIMTYNGYSQDINLSPNPIRDAEVLRSQNPLLVVDYCISIRKDRWTEAEPILIQEPSESTVGYIEVFIGHRWDPFETSLLEQFDQASNWGRVEDHRDLVEIAIVYINRVIRGPWLEFEKIILERMRQGRQVYRTDFDHYSKNFSPSFKDRIQSVFVEMLRDQE